jgi:hypothetical protein
MATNSDPMRWRGSSAEHVCWRRSATKLRLCLVLAHMMPRKTSVGPNEVMRLEVLRLKPPLLLARRRASLFLSHRGAPFPIRAGVPPGEASASHPVHVLPFAFCRAAVQPRLQEVHSTWLTDWRGRGEGEGPSHAAEGVRCEVGVGGAAGRPPYCVHRACT